MAVEKGRDWGAAGRLPDDGIVVRSDAEAREVVQSAKRESRPIPVCGLAGGDLCRTLGGRGDVDRLRSPDAMTFSADLGSVLLDGKIHWFVAHLVARRSWWWGRVVAVMNAEWFGAWDVAPRAHPNDGMLDVVDADLSFNDRLAARRRLSTGTHLPHPRIETQRVAAWQTSLSPELDVWLDGVRVGRARNMSVRVERDAFTVVV